MKIIEKADELEIKVYSRFLFRFWGVIFIAAGLFFLLPFLVSYQIICQDKDYNKAKKCSLRTSYMNLYQKEINLGELKSAVVSNLVENKANQIYFSLLLISSEGYFKISNIKSTKDSDLIQITNIIDEYIRNSINKSIKIPRVESWWSYFKIILFLLIGLGSLLFRLITLHFNKNTKTITISAKNLINTHLTKIFLKDVEGLLIEEHGKMHKEYSLSLILKEGKRIHLPGIHDSNLQHIEKIAQQISTQMNIKIQ